MTHELGNIETMNLFASVTKSTLTCTVIGVMNQEVFVSV